MHCKTNITIIDGDLNFFKLATSLLWLQGIYLKKVVLRLPTPADAPFGVLQGIVAGNSKFWDSENLQWQE